MKSLIEKTYDVRTSTDILKILKGQFLLYAREYNLIEYLSSDIDVLERRSTLFYDTLAIEGLKELLDDTVKSLRYISEIIRMQNNVGDDERGLYSVKQLTLYFEIIDALHEFYASHKEKFASADYIAWFDAVEQIAASHEYTILKRNTQPLIDKISTVKSISIGFNFDASFAPYEAGILSINEDYIKSGSLIDRIMRLNPHENTSLLSFAPLLPSKKVCGESDFESMSYTLYNAIHKIYKKAIKQWEPEINAYLATRLNFLLGNLQDLSFVSSVVGVVSHMQEQGLKLSKPIYCDKKERRFAAEGLYNPVLAMNIAEQGEGKVVVKNSIEMDDHTGIYLLTGANNGGKSVFMCAVGLAQIMAQIGMPVPADRMEVSPVNALFVVLPKHDSLTRDGRFAEECKIIQTMFQQVDAYSMLLLDELFSSTDPFEALTFSAEILKAMSCVGIRGIYATHFHALHERIAAINADDASILNIDSLVAEVTEENEERTYRILRMSPDGKSHARSIAQRYGISCDKLICRESGDVEGLKSESSAPHSI